MSLAETDTRSEPESKVPCLVISTNSQGAKLHRAFHGVDEALKHVEVLQNAEPLREAKIYLMKEIDLRH
jgi:hypothetical protein